VVYDENNISYEFQNLKKEPLEENFLRDVVRQLGLDVVVNSKGMTYRKLGLKDKNLSEEDLIKVLLEEQGMIKRPLVENKGRFRIGFDEQKLLDFAK